MKPEKQQRVKEIIQVLNANLKIDENNKDTSKEENVIRKAAKKLYKDFLHIAQKKLSRENKLFANEVKKQLKEARRAERTLTISTLLKNNYEIA